MGALLDLEQYTGKVTTEMKANYGPLRWEGQEAGVQASMKPGGNCTLWKEKESSRIWGSWPYSGGPQELEGNLGVGVGDVVFE